MNKQRNESSDSNARGAWAESLAERWLVQQGLIVQSKNFHRRLGELDLVLRDATNNRWVFVEVKYRQHNALVTGVDSITAKKRQRLRRTANLFLQHHKDHTSEARIDVLVVSPYHPDNDDLAKTSCVSSSRDGYLQQVVNGYHLLWIQNAIDGEN